MKVALLSLAVFGAQLTKPASDRLPQMNVDALCRARSAEVKLTGMVESRSVAQCVDEENDAKRELNTIWGSTSGLVRNQCESDATVDGRPTEQATIAVIPISAVPPRIAFQLDRFACSRPGCVSSR
jgi:hypothetical protein